MPFEVVLSQQQQTEVRVVVSSEQDIDPPLNAVAQGKLENNGIDLNKTPRQKPKRKKHRPKVIQEGKPARTPKPTTPKPVNPSGKRKYVRRNKVQLYSENPSSEPGETVVPGSSSGTKSISSTKDKEDNPSGKRKYVWKKKVENSSDNALGMPGGTVDPESSHGTKSVRRCLNFDSEAARARDECPESMQKFKINAESLAQEACLASNIIDIDVEPSAQYTRAMEVDNLVPGVPFVLDSSTDQMPNGYIRFVENPISHHQPCRREIVGTDQFLDECRTMAENPTTPPQPPKRENMKKLARKNFLSIVSNPERSQELGIIQLDSHETLNFLLTGTKGNHILDHDAQITTNTNFIHASNGVEKLGESHIASYHDPFLSQVNKRQRTEHENGFTYNTASSLMCLPSNVWRGHQVALNIAEAFPSADVQKIMGLKDQLASEGMLAFNQTENNTGKRLVLPLKPHSATSVSSMVDLSQMTKPGNQSGQNAMDHNNLSTPLQPFTDNGSQQSQNHEALTCMETKVVSTKSRMKKKQSRKKEKAQPVNHLISASQVYLQGQKAASCTFEYCPAQKIMEATESHGASYHDPYLSQGYKRQRTEHENGFTSNTASSLMCLPSNDWRGHQVALNIAEAFPSADVQKIMGLTDQLASEGMLALDQTENRTGKRLELPLKPHSATSASSMVDLSLMTKPGNQSGQNTMDHNNLSTPLQTFAGNGSQQSQNHEALTCMEAKVVSTKSRMKTKQSRKKEKAQPVNHLINASQVYLQGQKAASCSFEYCPAQKIMEATASTSWDFRQEVSHTSCVGNLNSGAIVPYGDPLDDVIWKLRHLTVIGFCEADTAKVQNSIVPYGGDGVLVPYGGLFDLTKKRRPRPKVDLDPETNRVWNLLMGKEGGAVGEGTEIDKEKWWEEERRVFRGRVDSFIARMHLVQGDRRFSKWKGSVVDSVVGVFLTQNVSDHLSSSAFMALAARFPLKSKCNNSEFNTEERDSCIKHEDSCIVALDDTNKWQAQISHKELHDPSSLVIVEDNETANSNESFGSNTSGIVADHYSKVKCLNSKETVIGDSHDWPDTQLGTPVTLTGSATVAQAEDRWLMEDAGSSQNSVSSQNSSENPVQTADQIGILSNIRVEDLTIRSMCDVIDNSTSFTELLNSVLDVSGNLSDTISSMSKAITNLEDAKHVMPSVSAALPLPNHCNKSSSSQNSVSLQNSSANPVQTADQIGILSNIRVEDLTIRSMCDVIDNSTSFTELLNSVLDVSGNLRDPISSMSKSFTNLQDAKHVMPSVSAAAPLPNLCNESSSLGFVVMDCVNALSDESIFHQDLSSSGTKYTNKFTKMESLSNHSVGNISEVISQKNLAAIPGSLPTVNLYAPTCRHFVQPLVSPEAESYHRNQFCCSSNPQTDISEAPLGTTISQKCSILQDDCTVKFQQEEKRLFEVERTKQSIQFQLQKQNFDNQQNFPNLHDDMNALEVSERVELDLKDNAYMSNKAAAESPKRKSKEKKVKDENERKKTYDWDSLRKEVHQDGTKMERSHNTMDSVDWEAVRSAEVNKISETIRERGMNNMLAERVKEFLNRLVRDHGSIDLEWLREIEPDKAKNYLLSIRGLGLKSVECVRLLTLHNLAFPVDTNVGRICVRLGWVPLQPLPESLQLHLLELYPVLETIQKYLWPRLCKLDQRTLYELHYQMITFGKVFCTKSKPNCNACPMRGECKHFASAFASARLALPEPEEKSLVSSAVPIALEKNHVPVLNPTHVPQLEGISNFQARAVLGNSEPIIEEPATPEPECIPLEESAIEDAFYEDPEEIPTITLNIEEFTQNLHNYMQANNMELQDVDMSKALVAINPEAASIPMPKLKNVSRLRTEHHVYELPDSHPLLEGLEPREPDDPSPYLLAIWTPGETAKSTEPPKASCNSQETGTFCNMATCFACNSRREAQAQIVRGTILIPCRTAMRGSFPLNGTYFQVNEVFADHDTSCNPIDVPREWIWNLPRRTVYFGTSIPTIFKGLTTEEIQLCFWRGFVCVRGFDRTTRAPKPLYARLHFPASKATRNKQQEISSSAKKTANN